ncbi:hypothetical protein AOLI_G00095660 [Acnodon oligacanthus]
MDASSLTGASALSPVLHRAETQRWIRKRRFTVNKVAGGKLIPSKHIFMYDQTELSVSSPWLFPASDTPSSPSFSLIKR